MIRIRISAVTHRGRLRPDNEDCVGWGGWSITGGVPASLRLELDVTAPLAVVVCDGMGGHAGGLDASRLACELITDPRRLPATADPDAIRDLLQNTSDTINEIAAARRHLTGMGCTVAGVVVFPDGSSLVFNVGDSRVYRCEDRYLAQLTVDHRAPGSSRLRQALGGGCEATLEPDFFSCRLPASPGLLLCTDGLHDRAALSDIEAVALVADDDVVDRLCRLALADGGDNITAVQVETLTGNGAQS